MTHYPGHVAPDQAAVYTIEIQGQIDENWLSYFDGLEIEVVRQGRSAITTITGCLIDQAALQGILQHLYGLGLVLLRVERKAHYCSRGNYPQTKKGNERNGSEE